MPSTENLYSHPPPRTATAAMAAAGAGQQRGLTRSSSEPGGVHSRSSSLTNLAGAARAKLHHLTHNQFVRYIEDNDAQDKDENDIYRGQTVRAGHRGGEACCRVGWCMEGGWGVGVAPGSAAGRLDGFGGWSDGPEKLVLLASSTHLLCWA